jgi:hypothetical protein
MNLQRMALIVLVPLALVPVGNSQTPNTKFADCPVTIARAKPADAHPGGLDYVYWNGNLYAGATGTDGTIRISRILSEGSFALKVPWFRGGGLTGKLTITGRRLDAAAPPLTADIPNGYADTGFQATGLIFPTEGCWEIKGKVGDTTLTFVNRVIRRE